MLALCSLESLALFNVGHPLLLLMLSNTTRVQIWSENGVFWGEQNLLAPPPGDRMGGTYKQAPERHQISLGASSVSLGLSGGEAFREMLAFGAHFPA